MADNQNQNTVQKPKRGFAITSLVLGILALLASASAAAIPLGIAAVVFFALQKTKKKLAWAGLITGVLGIAVAGYSIGTHKDATGTPPAITTSTQSAPEATAPVPQEPAELTLKDYQKLAVVLSYRKGVLKEYADGDKVTVSGKVAQKVDDTTFLVFTKEDEYGIGSDRVYVEFVDPPKIIEGDTVKVYGDYNGTQEYSGVLGNNNEVPKVTGKFVTVVKEK